MPDRANDIDKIRGAHAGRSALVIGSGPSTAGLADRDRLVDAKIDRGGRGSGVIRLPDASQPDRAHGHVTIAVNDGVLKMPDSDYYITGDPRMTYYNHWLVLAQVSTCHLLMPSFGPKRAAYRTTFGLERVLIYERCEDPNDWRMTIRDQRFRGELNSMIAGVNLAVILGCSPIYVIGCDCASRDGKMYFWEFPDQPGPGGTMEGHRSIWLESETHKGRKHQKSRYGKFYDAKKRATTYDHIIAKWERLAKANLNLDVVDLSAAPWSRNAFRRATVEEMLCAST